MIEQDELKVPSRRPLPPEVRNRLRIRVMTGLDAPLRQSRLDRARPPLAVAASVAVLAAGAMIVAQSITGSSGGTSSTPTTAPSNIPAATLNHQEADGELDRCWHALRMRGTNGQFPDRRKWQPVFNYTFGPVKVTAARAAGKPLFCETTYTTATVSDVNAAPAYATGSRTGALLTTALGTVAGVVDPSWRGIWAKGTGDQTEWLAPATAKDGLFLLHGPGITSGRNWVDVGQAPPAEDGPDRNPGTWLPLPRSAAPGISVVDRPAVPAPDRVSARGTLLDECLTRAKPATAVLDSESWAPGAVLRNGADRVLMARNEHGFASCWEVGGKVGFEGYRALRAAADDPHPAPVESVEVGGGLVIAGTVHQGCVRMQVMLKAGPVEADVSNATFAVFIPPSDFGPGNPKTANVKLFDANNRVIYEGPLE